MLDTPFRYHASDEVVGGKDGVGENLSGLRAYPVARIQPLLNEEPVVGLQQETAT